MTPRGPCQPPPCCDSVNSPLETSSTSPYPLGSSTQLFSVPSRFNFCMYRFRSSETECTGAEEKMQRGKTMLVPTAYTIRDAEKRSWFLTSRRCPDSSPEGVLVIACTVPKGTAHLCGQFRSACPSACLPTNSGHARPLKNIIPVFSAAPTPPRRQLDSFWEDARGGSVV